MKNMEALREMETGSGGVTVSRSYTAEKTRRANSSARTISRSSIGIKLSLGKLTIKVFLTNMSKG